MICLKNQDILKAYKNGLVGSWCDPEDTDKLTRRTATPTFWCSSF